MQICYGKNHSEDPARKRDSEHSGNVIKKGIVH